jgi:hypothetical protein
LLLQTKDAGFQVSVAGVVEYSIPQGNDAALVEKEKKEKRKEMQSSPYNLPLRHRRGVEV